MNVERRTVLKGLALSSLAGMAVTSSGLSMAGSVLGAQAQPVLPTLVLVNNEVAESVFLQGINASQGASTSRSSVPTSAWTSSWALKNACVAANRNASSAWSTMPVPH